VLPDKKFNFPKSLYTLSVKACLLGGVFVFFSWILFSTVRPPLPSEKEAVLFYSNQTSHDLKIVFKRAIQSAQKSLFIQIYGCTDPHLIDEIKKASNRGTGVRLFYDPSGSGALKKKIPFATPLPCKNGLMHKKILIADNELVFLGSANFTPTSLRMHDNLVIGLYQKDLASFLQSSTSNHFTCNLGDQPAEFWHLPDFKHECLERVLTLINEAKGSIHIALFTFTHPQILNALIKAKERGVALHVAIDFTSSYGASKKAVATLYKEKITPLISRGGKLLHHKWALIDENTLLLGSANWTESAFRSNEDCIFILHDLKSDQKKYLRRLWKEIERNSQG
jgi:phosphatidylserine/phosphatidylglycerophosphate/cardiolipin synthase-like enzyme